LQRGRAGGEMGGREDTVQMMYYLMTAKAMKEPIIATIVLCMISKMIATYTITRIIAANTTSIRIHLCTHDRQGTRRPSRKEEKIKEKKRNQGEGVEGR